MAGIIFMVGGWMERYTEAHLKSIGRPAIVAPITAHTERGLRGMETYTAQVSFKTESGQTITKQVSFQKEVMADFTAGTPVRVLYDPQDPTEFVFEKQHASWWLLGGGAALAVLALLWA